MGGRTQCGRTRATEAEANCDLREARDAASETEYSSVLQRLVTDSQASNAVVNVPADVSVEPLHKRLRTKSRSAPDSSAPTSKNSVLVAPVVPVPDIVRFWKSQGLTGADWGWTLLFHIFSRTLCFHALFYIMFWTIR